MSNNKAIVLAGLILVVISIGAVIQSISLNNQLNKEKEYSTKLDKIDKRMFILNSEALTATSEGITCTVSLDTACINESTAKVNKSSAEFRELVKERNSLKEEYGK